jgi:hypothetical protein
MSKKEILSLAENLMSYSLGSTVGFPMAVGNYSTTEKGACLAPADLTANVSKLHEFLFDTPNYTPTATVQGISSAITSETGIGYSGEEIVIDTKLLNYDTE